MYEKELVTLAERLMKYYPEVYSENSVKEVNKIIELVEQSLKLENKTQIRNNILRWEIFNDYSKKDGDSIAFQNALKYAENFDS